MSKIIISVDGMGGDNSPYSVVEGMEIFAKSHNDVGFLIFGDEKILTPLINKNKHIKNCTEIYHTSEIIKSDDKPSVALRKGKGSSMGLAIKAVKEGKADVVVSSGNTGALMSLSLFILKRISNVKRPAICSDMPVANNQNLTMLDLGGNSSADKDTLKQFALMGKLFRKIIHNETNPTIGLLNIGEEEEKGTHIIKEASEEFSNDNHFNYVGFVEGNNIMHKKICDIIVTDGFTGNVALKSIEGTAKYCISAFKQAAKSPVGLFLFIFAIPFLLKAKSLIDPNEFNGATFVGVKGISVKSHGNANGKAFSTAIKLGYTLAKQEFIKNLENELGELSDDK